MKPRLLDLFCGAGGAGMGYSRAGFDVYGVDITHQRSYPFPNTAADAIVALRQTNWLKRFDAIHASPPCQASCSLIKGNQSATAGNHVNLIPAVRELLAATGLPYVIENVQGSDLRRDYTLCGEMFGLGVIRHRYFEVSGFDPQPKPHVPHRGRVAGYRHGQWFDGPYFAVYGEGGGKGSVEQWREAMGIDWTWDRKEIAEAIPPAYTEFVGAHLLASVSAAA